MSKLAIGSIETLSGVKVALDDLTSYILVEDTDEIRSKNLSGIKQIRLNTRGNPIYKLDTTDTISTDDDFLVIKDLIGNRFKLVIKEVVYFKFADVDITGVTECSTKFAAGKAKAKALKVPFVLQGGAIYNLGSNSYDVDIYDECIKAESEIAVLKFTSAPTTYGIKLVGQYNFGDINAYTNRHKANHYVLENIAIMGDDTTPYAGKIGLRIGDGTKVTSLFSCNNVHISGFGFWGDFQDNSWAFKLINLHTKHGGLSTPTSPTDYGENITFISPFIADTVGEKLTFNRGEYTIHGGSIDNIEIVTNNDSTVRWFGGHIENPGSTSTTPRYVTCNDQSRFYAPSLEIVVNNPGANITEPVLYCEDGNTNGIAIDGSQWTQHSYYRPDLSATNPELVLVGGEGYVSCKNPKINAFTNFFYFPVSINERSGLRNGSFETGSFVGWTQSGTGTFTVDNTVFKHKLYSAKLTSSATNHCLISQNIPAVFGYALGGFFWKTSLASGATAQAQLVFLDEADATISTASFTSRTTDTDWVWVRLGGLVPKGTRKVQIKIENNFTGGAGTCDVWVDGVVLNCV